MVPAVEAAIDAAVEDCGATADLAVVERARVAHGVGDIPRGAGVGRREG